MSRSESHLEEWVNEEYISFEEMGKVRDFIEPFLKSKLEEFHLLGMERLTMDELWVFVLEMMKKKKIKEVYLHECINFIMRLSVNDYLNKIRLEMFKGLDLKTFGEQS